MGSVYSALVHYPIRGNDGSTITTGVTNLDVHDIARSSTTFGLRGYFVVSPIAAQRALVDRIVSHWKDGAGGKRIPARATALAIASSCRSIEDAKIEIAQREGTPPRVIATAASSARQNVVRTFVEESAAIRETSVPSLIVFGTGHGLVDSILDEADVLLEPIAGCGDYNHLSVRAAAAIVFDRLLGR